MEVLVFLRVDGVETLRNVLRGSGFAAVLLKFVFIGFGFNWSAVRYMSGQCIPRMGRGWFVLWQLRGDREEGWLRLRLGAGVSPKGGPGNPGITRVQSVPC